MPNAPTVNGIVETAVYVEDLDRSARFYRDLFGFEVEIQDELICVLRVPNGHGLLLFPRRIADEPGRAPSPGNAFVPSVGELIPPHGAGGRQHFSFSIPESERAAWRRRLADCGVAVEEEIRWPRGGTSLYFRDPDGHSVELTTPGLWTFY